jgi:hypothetical protein
VVGLARMSDPELADWIETEGAFPNSMVDSIVPATGPDELRLVRELGIDDAAPVTHENFRQWVIEDDFCAGRPDWDRVGATFTSDVHGYEMMKIRILNAGHQVLANAGELLSVADHRRLHGPCRDRSDVPQGPGRGDPAPCRAGARHHAGRVSVSDRTAFLQPRDPGHDAARGVRRLVPPSGLPFSRDPGGARHRDACRGARAGRGALGAHVRRPSGGRHASSSPTIRTGRN